MTNQLIPRLRFKQFDDNYTNTKFNSLVKRISKHSNNANLPRLSFDNVISGTGITINQNNYKGDGTLFNKNDILFGKLRPYLKNWVIAKNKGIAIGDFWVFRPYNANHLFIYYLIQTSRYNHVANITSGTKMPRSEWGLVSRYTFNIPTLSEQQKIGTFFAKLDHMIKLQNKKLAHLKKLKKGYLQKMFPQKGENVPRLRFNGFYDEWNKNKLGNIVKLDTGYSFKSKLFNRNGKFLVVTNSNIKNNSSFVDTKIGNYINIQNNDLISKYKLYDNQILITMDGNVGRSAKVSNENHSNMVLAQRVARVTSKNSNYFYSVFNTQNFKANMMNKSHGGTIKHISLNDIKTYNLQIPFIQEQNQIGQFFKYLNQSINQQENKLFQLKQLKKGYLQKMFI